MRIIFYIIWLLLIGIFQPTLARAIDIFAIAPNLFLCFITMNGFYRGRYEGAICGAIFGMVFDLLCGRLIGISSLIYVYLGFASGMISEHFGQGGKRMAGAVMSAVGTILATLVYFIVSNAAYGDISLSTAIFRLGLIEAVYNAIVGLLISFPMVKMMKLMRLETIL